ncbi:MAG: hypothetical protein ACFFD4_30160 [Candidatus Odinarchaeota archaeon]
MTAMTTSNTLSSDEKEFIELFVRNFDAEGRKRGMGQIMALLMYKGEQGLTQNEIANLLDLSVSQVSRLLKILVDSKRCSSSDSNVRTDKGRLEKKYFFKSSLKEMVADRMKHGIKEYTSLKNDTILLREKVMKQDAGKHGELIANLQRMEKMSDDIILFFTKAMELAGEIFSDT